MVVELDTVPAHGSDSRRWSHGEDRSLARGTTVGRYCILDEIGRGAMGIVYAAYDPKLDRRVAVKVLQHHAREPAALDMLREAQALARLSHPNVVQVYDVGEHLGQVFMAMEFVVGRPLRAWLREAPRSLTELLPVFAAAARGLAATHDAGIVHRDIKPDNVMIADDARVLVMDFGLAITRADDDDGGEEDQHFTAGTPLYMAPELFLHAVPDERSDQFSFCVALHEAVVGDRPFAAADLPALRRVVLAGKLANPHALDVAPRWLRRLILRGLAVSPADRHPSMHAIADGLDRARSVRRFLVPAIAVASIATAVAVVGTREGAQERACRDAGRGDAGWQAPGLELARAQFSASRGLDAEVEWPRVASAIDGFAGAWADAYDAACTRAHVTGELSSDRLEITRACLDDQRDFVEALLLPSEVPSSEAAWALVAAVAELPSPASCMDDQAERSSVVPGPRSEIHREFARAQGRDALGDRVGALEHAERALAELPAPAAASTRARLLAIVATSAYDLGDLARGHAASTDALREASRAGDPQLVADLWITHARTLLLRDKSRAQADTLLFAATVAAAAVPQDAAIGSRLAGLQAQVAMAEHHHRAAFDAALAAVVLAEVAQPRVAALAARYDELAHAEAKLGWADAAISHQRHAMELLVAAYGEHHPQALAMLDSVGLTCNLAGDRVCARASFERALAQLDQTLPVYALVMVHLGQLDYDEGDLDAAERAARTAIELYVRRHGEEHAALSAPRLLLFNVLHRRGRHDEALAEARAFAALKDATTPSGHPGRAQARAALGQALRSVGELEAAEQALREALALREQALDPGDPAIDHTLIDLASLLLERGRADQAEALAVRALARVAPSRDTAWWRGEAQLVAARTLATRDPQRARILCAEATAEFEAAGVLGRERLAEAKALQTQLGDQLRK